MRFACLLICYSRLVSAQAAGGADVLAGQKLFQKSCTACHGDKGEGNKDFGAPRLSDKIWLYGGTVPVQSQEMICGGRYLSSDDAMRVFAAGTETNRMRIEVRWRSGKRSVVEGVRANREYEIDEMGAIGTWTETQGFRGRQAR